VSGSGEGSGRVSCDSGAITATASFIPSAPAPPEGRDRGGSTTQISPYYTAWASVEQLLRQSAAPMIATAISIPINLVIFMLVQIGLRLRPDLLHRGIKGFH
jgi:hypothetical protein